VKYGATRWSKFSSQSCINGKEDIEKMNDYRIKVMTIMTKTTMMMIYLFSIAAWAYRLTHESTDFSPDHRI
jgi:hypothetical protein